MKRSHTKAKMTANWILLSILSTIVAYPLSAKASDTIDLLSGSKVTYWGGSEFPGAKGSIALIPEPDKTSSIQLSYDLGCGTTKPIARQDKTCGRYVSFNIIPPRQFGAPADSNPAISLEIKSEDSTAAVGLRVVDATGQTLQYQTKSKSIENPQGDAWSRIQIGLNNPILYWGGAKDGKIRFPIKQIAILGGDMKLLWPQSSFKVRNIKYHSNNDIRYELPKEPTIHTIGFPSSYEGRLAVAAHKYNQAAFAKAQEVGIRIIRIDVFWNWVENKGKLDFTYYTKLRNQLAQHGMQALWILDYGHRDHGGKVPNKAEERAAFVRYAQAAVKSLEGPNTYGFEIWNEPNHEGFWPAPNPESFASLFEMTMQGIRVVSPASRIISGGIAGTDDEYIAKMVATGKFRSANGIGIHPYRHAAPETLADDIHRLRKITSFYGVEAPFYDTEWGYTSYGHIPKIKYGPGQSAAAQNRQGALIIRRVLTTIALNLPLFTVYDLINDGNDPTNGEHNFGLLAYDGSEKPSFLGLRTLYSAQLNRSLKGVAKNSPPGLHLIQWDGPNDRVFALWNDDPSRTIDVSIPMGFVKATSWAGETITPRESSPDNRLVTLSEEGGPIFVTLLK